MSYVVLARKWRPMKFEEVVSQDHVATTLRNAISNDRLASAYLFSGPRGIGKTTTARIFAKAINCDNGPTTTPCNSCNSCTEITESRSLDVFEIDGASNRGIDEVRNLRENLKYAASKGKHKIYIIDEVHMLTTEAFNALLKTLEEPPPKVLFIFATTEVHKVPATILSRCQRYDFRRIPTNEIADTLKTICNAENVKIDDAALYLIARKADGSLRDSQSLLDQVISFCGDDVKLDELTELLGIIDQEIFFECSKIIANKDVNAGLMLVDKIFNQGYDMAEFLNGLAEHLRNILVVKATQKTHLLEGLESYRQRYTEATSDFSETDLLRLVQISSEAAYQVKRSTSPKLNLEMAIIKMVKMDKSIELNTLLSNLPNPDATVPQVTQSSAPFSSASTPSAQSNETPAMVTLKQLKPTIQSEAPPNQTPVANGHSNGNGAAIQGPAAEISADQKEASLEKIKSDWPQIVDAVKKMKIHLGSFLNEGYPTRLQGGALEISFGKNNTFHLRTVQQNRKMVQEAVLGITGLSLRIQCHQNDTEEFKQALTQHRSVPVVEIEDEPTPDVNDDDMLEIPLVKKVIEIFDGEIVKTRKG